MLEAWDRRDRISAISCITLSPWEGRPGLYFELLPVNQTVHAEDVVAFLKELRRQLRARSRWCGIGMASTTRRGR